MDSVDYPRKLTGISLKPEAISAWKISADHYFEKCEYINLSPVLLGMLNEDIRYKGDFTAAYSEIWDGLYLEYDSDIQGVKVLEKLTNEKKPERNHYMSNANVQAHTEFFNHYFVRSFMQFGNNATIYPDASNFSLLKNHKVTSIQYQQLFQDLLFAWMILGNDTEAKKNITDRYFVTIVEAALKSNDIAEKVKAFHKWIKPRYNDNAYTEHYYERGYDAFRDFKKLFDEGRIANIQFDNGPTCYGQDTSRVSPYTVKEFIELFETKLVKPLHQQEKFLLNKNFLKSLACAQIVGSLGFGMLSGQGNLRLYGFGALNVGALLATNWCLKQMEGAVQGGWPLKELEKGLMILHIGQTVLSSLNLCASISGTNKAALIFNTVMIAANGYAYYTASQEVQLEAGNSRG